MDIDIESLERATLDAVAPAEVGTLPGWLLPFDQSTVGRAISAVPLQHADMDPALIAEIETHFAQRALKTQFRLAAVTGLANLQQALQDRGYTAHQATLTLVGTVDSWPAAETGRAVLLRAQPTEAWRSVYLSDDFDPKDGADRVRALSRSQSQVYASICDASGPIAAGTGLSAKGGPACMACEPWRANAAKATPVP